MRLLLSFALLVGILPGVAHAQDDNTDTAHIAYTYQNASGNRYLPAISTALDVEPVTMQLEGPILWIVGGEVGGSPVWVTALEDGRVFAAQPEAGLAIQISETSPGQPIAARFAGDGLPTLLTAGEDLSPLSHPVQVTGEMLAYVAENGELVLWRDGEELDRTPAMDNLQPDARPVISADGLIATYTGATDARYVHGIMGDDLEAAAITVYDPADDELTHIMRVTLPGEDVFEGISPFWADVDDDGQQEIVTTVSNGTDGAWLRVYTVQGDVLAESRPIGQGFRWRHQLLAGPYGINGETQLVDVRTPHIGGMPEFFTLEGDALVVNNAQLGYTSHIINSRNLDMGLGADFDGDGTPEVVVTDQARQVVFGLNNTTEGVQHVWALPFEAGSLSSNFAAIGLPGGGGALAAGTDTGVLYVWRGAP